MASSQLISSAISAKGFASFEGLRASSSSVESASFVTFRLKSFRGLVVKAATGVAPKIREIFHRCQIVGRRFPICRVQMKGSVVEVSSFETVPKQAKGKGEFIFPQMPRGCDTRDLLRRMNCMGRDFAINSLVLLLNSMNAKKYIEDAEFHDAKKRKNDDEDIEDPKMDKAALLAEVITHVKEMRKNADEATKGMLVPTDTDEVIVKQQTDASGETSCTIREFLCCDYKHEMIIDLRKALESLPLKTVRAEISTLENRMVNVFVIIGSDEGQLENNEAGQLLVSSVREALMSVLDKFTFKIWQ